MRKNNPKIFYNRIWKYLLDGANRSQSEFHTFSLATLLKDSLEIRTVVLRKA